jgi:hypothetical protein
VAHEDARAGVRRVLQGMGVVSDFAGEPYEAMGELCQRPLVYRMVVLSLQGVYQEELSVIPAIKRRFPHVEVYLAHTDGRQGAMAEGMRLGADGIVSDQGVHRTAGAMRPVNPPAAAAIAPAAPPAPVTPPATPQPVTPVARLDLSASEPLLTAEELRALLDDEPLVSGGEV